MQRLPYILLETSSGSNSLNAESSSPTSTRHQRLCRSIHLTRASYPTKGPCSMCNTPSSIRATLAHHVVVQYAAVPVLRIVRHAHVSPLPTTGDATAKALSSAGASCAAAQKYSLYMGLVWSDQTPSRLNQNFFFITKASFISSCGIMRRTFSQVSRSFPLEVWTDTSARSHAGCWWWRR